MDLRERIDAFINLGTFLGQIAPNIKELTSAEEKIDGFSAVQIENIQSKIRRAEAENGWFVRENIKFAFESWSQALSKENIHQWLSVYNIKNTSPKTIAVIMAGNIPLVGMHDFLSVLITGNKALVKLSTNDRILLPMLTEFLVAQNSEFENLIQFSEGKLENFDAVIATGSNNTARYFDYYFGKYPHIIRKNRNSVAVLTGDETEEDLRRLADDIFRYFGLGCRNVSKLFVPPNYSFDRFFNGMFSWKEIIHNNKYINNYDYNKAVYLMDSLPLLDNEFLLLKEDGAFSSPIAVVFYEQYSSMEDLQHRLEKNKDQIQCVVSNDQIVQAVPFGKAQLPELWDYADKIDTVNFLLNLDS